MYRFKLVILLLTTLGGQAWANSVHYTGYAYDEDQALLYTEHYTEFYARETNKITHSEVRYVAPPAESKVQSDSKHELSETVAVKNLDYTSHPYAPEFRFKNLLTGYQESLIWLEPDVILLSSTDDRGKEKQKIVKLDIGSRNSYVADAGFDQFLRANLQQIAEGKDLEFRFLNPARLDWFRFEASLVKKSEESLVIKVRPKATLLRWLVDPIVLTYNIGQQQHPPQRLLTYEGLTNISFDDKNYVNAKITYEYQAPNNHPIALVF